MLSNMLRHFFNQPEFKCAFIASFDDPDKRKTAIFESKGLITLPFIPYLGLRISGEQEEYKLGGRIPDDFCYTIPSKPIQDIVWDANQKIFICTLEFSPPANFDSESIKELKDMGWELCPVAKLDSIINKIKGQDK